MKKKLLVLLSIATVSMVTVFAASSYMVEKPQMLSFDTQIGYATQVIKIDADLGSMDSMQGSVFIGEKVTYATEYPVDFTAAINYNFVVNGKYTEDPAGGSSTTSDMDSDEYQNSFNIFIGVEKTVMINEQFTAHFAVGPHYCYYMENESADTSLYTYGLEGIAKVLYNLSPRMNVSAGINVAYDPFIGGDGIEDVKDLPGYSDYAYSITPTVGFVYSL